MNKVIRLIVVLAAAAGLTGCFQVDQVITLSPDGSGTLEETFMISRKIAASMAAFSGEAREPGKEVAGGEPQDTSRNFFQEDDIKKKAGSLGADVRFISMKRVATDEFEGYKALYTFKNIRTLQLDQGSPGMPGQMGNSSGTVSKGPQFIFTPGKTALLVVKQPDKGAFPEVKSPETGAPAGKSSPEELALMRQMFNGMRISTRLVIKGQIIASNATYRTGSTITLADIDFGKILDKPDLLEKLATVPPGDQTAAMAMLRSLPGMTVEMNNEVRVSFK